MHSYFRPIPNLVRYVNQYQGGMPALGEGDAVAIGGPNNVCDVELECLYGYPDLWGLHIQNASIFNLLQLRRWPNLKYLALDDLEEPVDCSFFQRLVNLAIDWVPGSVLPHAGCSLRRLGMGGYDGLDLARLPAWRTLEHLEIVQGRLRTLAGVERFSSLLTVAPAYLRNLTTLEPLARCPVLWSLHATNCKRVQDWPAMQACQALKELVLVRCGDVPSLRFLDSMPKLETVRLLGTTNVVDGDMTPLIRVQRPVFDFKRHYSHREHEIQALATPNPGGPAAQG